MLEDWQIWSIVICVIPITITGIFHAITEHRKVKTFFWRLIPHECKFNEKLLKSPYRPLGIFEVECLRCKKEFYVDYKPRGKNP